MRIELSKLKRKHPKEEKREPIGALLRN